MRSEIIVFSLTLHKHWEQDKAVSLALSKAKTCHLLKNCNPLLDQFTFLFFQLIENICSSSGQNSCTIKTSGSVCFSPSLSCLTQHVKGVVVTRVCRAVQSTTHHNTGSLIKAIALVDVQSHWVSSTSVFSLVCQSVLMCCVPLSLSFSNLKYSCQIAGGGSSGFWTWNRLKLQSDYFF